MSQLKCLYYMYITSITSSIWMGLFMVAANVVTCWAYSKLQRSVSKCLLAVT